jgi:hypothetical protein
MAAEMTTETIVSQQPYPTFANRKVYFVVGTATTNSDFITISGLTTVQGALLSRTDSVGTFGTCTYATNVVTVTNATTGVWSGIVWGV